VTAILYTAKRRLSGGHVAGVNYSLEVAMAAIDREEKSERTKHRSLDGAPETWLLRIDIFWHYATGDFDSSDPRLAQLREFLASVAAGELFTVDPYGTVDDPVEPLLCELESTGYREVRQGTRFLSLSFSVREV
jgi:hypothetical protein